MQDAGAAVYEEYGQRQCTSRKQLACAPGFRAAILYSSDSLSAVVMCTPDALAALHIIERVTFPSYTHMSNETSQDTVQHHGVRSAARVSSEHQVGGGQMQKAATQSIT